MGGTPPRESQNRTPDRRVLLLGCAHDPGRQGLGAPALRLPGGFSQNPLPLPQGLCQATAAADGHESDSEELRRLPQAAELAVVEAVHQSECRGTRPCRNPPPGSAPQMLRLWGRMWLTARVRMRSGAQSHTSLVYSSLAREGFPPSPSVGSWVINDPDWDPKRLHRDPSRCSFLAAPTSPS